MSVIFGSLPASASSNTVPNGGTGASSFTAYAPVFGGTTSTNPLQSGTVGTAGQVLTSNGAGALPTFQAAGGGASGANPTASVGLTAVNGAAATFLRSDGAPALDQSIAPTWTGAHTWSKAGAASVSPLLISGTILTGGTGTTNFPHLFMQPAGTTAQTNWSTSGTYIGINAPNAFAGNFIHCQSVSNVDLFKVASNGAITSTYWTASSSGANTSNAGYIGWAGRSLLYSSANGKVTFSNASVAAGIILDFSAGTGVFRNFADSGAANLTCGSLVGSGNILCGATQQLGHNTRTLQESSASGKLRWGPNAMTTGVAFDVLTDGLLKIRTFADAADGNLQAATITATTVLKLPGYTVATLPAGAAGMTAYVTDATAPAYLVALTGGGGAFSGAKYTGAAWVSA